MVPRCGKESLHGAIRPQTRKGNAVGGFASRSTPLRILPGCCQNHPSVAPGIEQSCSASQTAIGVSGGDKAIVLDPAAYAIRAVFGQRFDPYHADPAKNWPHSISAVGMMHRDSKGALPDLPRHKRGVHQTVEPVAAEVVSHGLHDLAGTGPNEVEWPVDQHPGSSSPLS
jgi:hypothetical protein